ncbi:ArsR/SmtB family transcription factor [Adonisia turfae]|uniref:ArsR/SmtB family transcription factor n=1 Tax=Adonisia turfae TaxID=2950184 RepID=UPI0032B5BC89
METQPHQVEPLSALLENHFEQIAERFKLLSDPSRLRIISAICSQERNVTEICQRAGLNQANVSKHLQLLKCSGVVTCRRVGSCRYYRIIDKDLLSLCARSLTEIEQFSLSPNLRDDIHVQNSIQNHTGFFANHSRCSCLPSNRSSSAGTRSASQSCSGD